MADAFCFVCAAQSAVKFGAHSWQGRRLFVVFNFQMSDRELTVRGGIISEIIVGATSWRSMRR